MKDAILGIEARSKMERLCDSVHPQECGGLIYGSKTAEKIFIRDVLPVPNVSDNPAYNYKAHGLGQQWKLLYGRAVGMECVGSFHSHPHGKIPSEADIKVYGDDKLHLWVIHHGVGEHTFQASLGLTHVKLIVVSSPLREALNPKFTGETFHLGEIEIDVHGHLVADEMSLTLLGLNEKQRMAYLGALRLRSSWNRISKRDLAKVLKVMVPTLRRWMKPVEKAGLVSNHRGYWRVK